MAAPAAPSKAADKPSDPQIAHIAYTAGDLDIKAAKIALEKSKSKDVRAFADNMVKDHTAVNDQALALVKKLNVTPEDNATSKSLSKEAAEKTRRADETFGRGLRQGLRRQRGRLPQDSQRRALDNTDPSASNAELKSFLQTGLKIFQGHEQHAEHLAGL